MLIRNATIAFVSIFVIPFSGLADAVKSEGPGREERAWEEHYRDTDPVRARLSTPPRAAAATTPSHPVLGPIRRAILARKDAGEMDIGMTYRDGTVHLSGFVGSREAISEVERIARSVPDVERVENELALWPALDDPAVESSLLAALRREENVDLSRVRVSVEGGIARFEGLVSDHREIDRMLSVALMVQGVRGIESRVALADPGSR